MYLPIYQDAGGAAPLSPSGPLVDFIELLNCALPSELRAFRTDTWTVGERVKNAVEEVVKKYS